MIYENGFTDFSNIVQIGVIWISALIYGKISNISKSIVTASLSWYVVLFTPSDRVSFLNIFILACEINMTPKNVKSSEVKINLQ